MGYKVKWVEDHLGISRKALRNYERLGLMPPNKDEKYRDYSDEDIDRIWSIKILQGVERQIFGRCKWCETDYDREDYSAV